MQLNKFRVELNCMYISFLQDVFPDKATERKILSFAIKCPSDGCEWTGELRNKEVKHFTFSTFLTKLTFTKFHWVIFITDSLDNLPVQSHPLYQRKLSSDSTKERARATRDCHVSVENSRMRLL